MPELNLDNIDDILSSLKKEGENPHTTARLLGSSAHSRYDRPEHDLYVTDQSDFIRFLKALLKRDGFELQWPILEPSCGLGHLVEVMQKMYKGEVIACDLENREHWPNFKSQIGKVHYRNFLKDDYSDLEFNTILTNPPFSEAEAFVRRSLDLLKDGQHLMLMLRIQWLETIARYKLFQEFPYKYVYVYTKRAKCYRGNRETEEGVGMMAFVWVIYEKGWRGEPVIRFIE